ncbi:MAG: hemin uptake protein HemP [Gemmobacter sp.]|nr:hemin uptake protein HemP [Gemmobacter sp.]
MNAHVTLAPAPTLVADPKPQTPPTYDAQDLTQGGSLAQIHLNGQIYALRITRAGKLILTK